MKMGPGWDILEQGASEMRSRRSGAPSLMRNHPLMSRLDLFCSFDDHGWCI